MIFKPKKLSLTALSLLISSSAWATAPQCGDLFKDSQIEKIVLKEKDLTKTQRSLIEKQAAEDYSSLNVEAYKNLKLSLQTHPELKNQKSLVTAMEQLIAREELSSFHEILNNALSKLKYNRSAATNEQIREVLKKEILKQISTFMSKADAKERVKILDQKDLTMTDLMQALGKMTAEESLQALIGKHGIHNIDADSLVGRYLEKSKAKGTDVQTFVGTFQKGYAYEGRGSEKLFVSVDKNTIEALAQIVKNNPHLLIHKHVTKQDTLTMHYQNYDLTYSGHKPVEATLAEGYNVALGLKDGNVLATGSIVPAIVLSSLEASNVKNYFELGRLKMKYAKFPWAFVKTKNLDGKRVAETYCAHGGYTTCTHWIGEMPIGEKLVENYAFPGVQDIHGDNKYDAFYADTKALRTKDLGTYTKFKNPDGKLFDVGNQTREDRLARMVWKENAGHEQLWSVVGDENARALQAAEWANPGWTVITLIARTKQDRVPVVFMMRDDASQPLNHDVLDRFMDGINAY